MVSTWDVVSTHGQNVLTRGEHVVSTWSTRGEHVVGSTQYKRTLCTHFIWRGTFQITAPSGFNVSRSISAAPPESTSDPRHRRPPSPPACSLPGVVYLLADILADHWCSRDLIIHLPGFSTILRIGITTRRAFRPREYIYDERWGILSRLANVAWSLVYA